jgi:effector-binding domain-containing protein
MIELYDAAGKKYNLAGGEGSTIDLQDEQGNIIHVPAGELCKRYSGYPPEVQEAARKLIDMVASGKITWDEIRKIKEAL